MSSEPLCWTPGNQWSGTPVGTEGMLAKNRSYITGDLSSKAAILFIHDALGWEARNSRLLADAYAQQVNAAVFLPDFFGGSPVPIDIMEDPVKRKEFDIPAFMVRNSKEIRWPEMAACAKELREKYPKIGAIGFCFGGWGVFRLAAGPDPLVDAIVCAHPTRLTKEEIEAAAVPTQLIAPEFDQSFNEELKAHCQSVFTRKGIEYDYQYFPRMMHAFATRGDEGNEVLWKACVRARQAAIFWFQIYLS